ncbi:MAG: CpsD/CapB family tyrosine-protein kinase [Alphaproteobacteria bacterium]|nr:CpsD/CapB family tyrosine-protein kinase [Alphaproteobacteria bacterium]MBU1512947.1 CpsD/CapB family tyrosine-protein kinase [Alphaproteobacteria bacterium]MBU2094879.1 CpsD/CapB family tyrosine-protein kinase [Alphaproteobacteria bacterium]MBU2152785.1 CpsD/CapB family tyrosine-protein kinase [Alphaproteobacteria bacterium]MBU2306306.1 CpsD/CapB family tyrosine-protein kinase [Alphaproteobacteria bacterium]
MTKATALVGDVAAPRANVPALAELVHGYEFSRDVVMLNNDRPDFSEAIRAMRTNIVARHLGDGRRGLAITAPDADSMCTFTSVNLAVAMAQIGVSTLLVDGNMRTPGVDSFIRPTSPTLGLAQCLAMQCSAHEALHANIVPNLSIVYSGGEAPNAHELLGGEQFTKLVQTYLRDFDLTIIDTPPAKAFADARRIAGVVGYATVIARRDISLMSEIVGFAESLLEDGTQIIGTVLCEV